ncbi:hypothetical protein [Sphingomonas psychrotolerans]|nr:hypothetical protein [Sphingomonas psychrotolerans]
MSVASVERGLGSHPAAAPQPTAAELSLGDGFVYARPGIDWRAA